MHKSELKELIEKKLKKGLDTSYLYESNYGEMSEATFLYRKQTLLINTSTLQIEGNPIWILTIDNPFDFYNCPANKVLSYLTLTKVPPEVWLDGVKVQEGNSIRDILGNTTLVATYCRGTYYIKKEIESFCHND